MHKSPLLIFLLIVSLKVYAQLPAPNLVVSTEGLQVTLEWSTVDKASGYRLSYAPYPFQGVESISSIDLDENTEFSVILWQQAAFYVAVQSYDEDLEHSAFSNIGFLLIQDQGEDYRNYWRTVTKEINEKSFTSDELLYTKLPDIDSCSAGTINEFAQLRQLEALNEVRKLHQLPSVSYADDANMETQQAALIQRANNFLSHTPPDNSLCFSQLGYSGSNSSNLHLGNGNSDPADNIFGFINDALNVSTVAGVGHRRTLLNPFMQFTSYAQVFGASAVKVADFSISADVDANQIPNFIAVPYLRYPSIFFSAQTSANQTPWSLSIIEDKSSFWANQYNYFAASKLSIRQKDNGELMNIEDLHTDTKASGVPNNLSWTVTNWQYDTWYTVTIDNISYPSGETKNIQYDVFIDYKNIIDITAPLETGDQQSTTSIQGTLFDNNDKDSYEVNLVGNIAFSGSSQFSNMAFYIAVFDANKQLLASKDENFSLDLIAGRYTIVISNCHQQTCYTQPKAYTVQFD